MLDHIFSLPAFLLEAKAFLDRDRPYPSEINPRVSPRKSLLRERHCHDDQENKNVGKGSGRRRGESESRKEGLPLTNNHSRSITTNDSSVAEDETVDAARASHERRVDGKSSTLVSCQQCVEALETELRHEAADAMVERPIRVVWHASNNARNYDAFQPFVRSLPVTPRRLSTIPGKCTISFANIVPLLCLSPSSGCPADAYARSTRTDDDFYIVTVRILQ